MTDQLATFVDLSSAWVDQSESSYYPFRCGPDPALASQACQKLLILRTFGDSSVGEPAGLRRGRALLLMGLYTDVLDLLNQLTQATHPEMARVLDHDAIKLWIQEDEFLGALIERPDEATGLLADSSLTLDAISVLDEIQEWLTLTIGALGYGSIADQGLSKEARECVS